MFLQEFHHQSGHNHGRHKRTRIALIGSSIAFAGAAVAQTKNENDVCGNKEIHISSRPSQFFLSTLEASDI